MAAERQTRHHRWQIRQPAVLSKLRSSALWLLRLLSATTAKSISEVKPSNKGAHIIDSVGARKGRSGDRRYIEPSAKLEKGERRCTERTIRGPTLVSTSGREETEGISSRDHHHRGPSPRLPGGSEERDIPERSSSWYSGAVTYGLPERDSRSGRE